MREAKKPKYLILTKYTYFAKNPNIVVFYAISIALIIYVVRTTIDVKNITVEIYEIVSTSHYEFTIVQYQHAYVYDPMGSRDRICMYIIYTCVYYMHTIIVCNVCIYAYITYLADLQA